MLNTTDKIIKHKTGLLNLAEELGNVSKACQVMGMSRDTFYRYKAAVEEGGVEALFERTLKGVGRIYQQSYVDPYSKVAQAKLYTTKTPITAADLLNDRVLPFHDEHDLPVLRIMTDRGTEYCGRVDKHDYQLFLAINDIDHTKTKVKSPQTNGIRERFHKTVLQEFYQVAFRKRLYDSVDALQADLDQWLHHYNTERTHQGKMCCGRTPFQTMIEGKEIWKEKFVN